MGSQNWMYAYNLVDAVDFGRLNAILAEVSTILDPKNGHAFELEAVKAVKKKFSDFNSDTLEKMDRLWLDLSKNKKIGKAGGDIPYFAKVMVLYKAHEKRLAEVEKNLDSVLNVLEAKGTQKIDGYKLEKYARERHSEIKAAISEHENFLLNAVLPNVKNSKKLSDYFQKIKKQVSNAKTAEDAMQLFGVLLKDLDRTMTNALPETTRQDLKSFASNWGASGNTIFGVMGVMLENIANGVGWVIANTISFVFAWGLCLLLTLPVMLITIIVPLLSVAGDRSAVEAVLIIWTALGLIANTILAINLVRNN